MMKKFSKTNEEIDGDRIKKTASLVRILPNSITIAALCFGLTAIRFALFQKWEEAVFCVFASAILDSFDGRVARMLGQLTHFGAELDSLSDLVCFGVAPSILLFLKSMYFMEEIGWGICMFFTICCTLRLARFNATIHKPKPSWSKKYFEGIPAPAGAILALFPLVLHFTTGSTIFLNPVLVAFCMIASGILMISTIKNFSSKMIEIKHGYAPLKLLAVSMIIISLITVLWQTLSVLILAYIFMIPVGSRHYAKQKDEETCEKTLPPSPQE